MNGAPNGSVPAKQCTDCGQVLPSTEFYWVSKPLGTLRGQCKACMRRSKTAQRDPAWTPNCSRCDVRLPERTGSGRRLCDECFGQTYDLEHRRANGAHRIRLKPCTLCGGPKERMARGKLCQACKPWAGYAKSLRRFDLTPADYVSILQAQGGVCYICHEAPRGQRLSIDHDHALPEGRAAVRGLLCRDCNYSRLPRFEEDLAMLQRAISYLTAPPARSVIGQIGGHDLAVLHAFARDDSGGPWEFDVDVADPGPIEPRFALLNLSDPRDDAPRPSEPPHPAEYAFL
ncbi:endonuclease domain-containing protein [Actinoallomurus iriomotensis]|uniref:Recombination endonuclease VII n=1 Tax=Actinoallomurus iriomotensis TaxID=478107 RepID=A0A9W6SEY2_9ACTN|nr:endonuclease domain-containing protein [Actinoallomurus iriomotensis]GLY91555.1 hypothetical protein Airi02_094830 [Actinoallomurus iriomotensis]